MEQLIHILICTQFESLYKLNIDDSTINLRLSIALHKFTPINLCMPKRRPRAGVIFHSKPLTRQFKLGMTRNFHLSKTWEREREGQKNQPTLFDRKKHEYLNWSFSKIALENIFSVHCEMEKKKVQANRNPNEGQKWSLVFRSFGNIIWMITRLRECFIDGRIGRELMEGK